VSEAGVKSGRSAKTIDGFIEAPLVAREFSQDELGAGVVIVDRDLSFEFFLRLAAHGYRFLHVPAVLSDFRFQRASKTCTVPHKQLEEIDGIMHLYSPVSRRFQTPVSRRVMFALLRSCAAALRYSQKLMRGYYFDQFRLATIER